MIRITKHSTTECFPHETHYDTIRAVRLFGVKLYQHETHAVVDNELQQTAPEQSGIGFQVGHNAPLLINDNFE